VLDFLVESALTFEIIAFSACDIPATFPGKPPVFVRVGVPKV